MRLSVGVVGIFLQVVAKVLAGGDPKVAKMGVLLQEKIEKLRCLDPNMSLDDLADSLEPILINYGFQIWVTKRTTASLRKLGFTDDLIQGFLRRRRRDRVRELRFANENGDYTIQHRNKRPKIPSGRSHYFASKRKEETRVALDAEIKLIESRMDKVGLSFEDDPEILVAHYNDLKGDKLTRNHFGRIMYIMMERKQVTKDWKRGYKLAIRRRSSYIKREAVKEWKHLVGKRQTVSLLKGELRKKQSSEDNNTAKSEESWSPSFKGILDDAMDIDSANYDDELPTWRHSPLASDADETMAISSNSHLKEPLHHFQLPYSWIRSDSKDKVLLDQEVKSDQNDTNSFGSDATSSQESILSEDELEDTISHSRSSHEQEDSELKFAAMQTEQIRPSIAQKTYRGSQRPSTAAIGIHL